MFQLTNLAQGGRRGAHSQSWSAHLPVMQWYYVLFMFNFHGNFFPKGRECLPHSHNRLISSFFAFSILPCLLPITSSGKLEQKVAGIWPVCPITELQARRKVPLTKFLAFDIQSGKEAWPSALNSINGVCPHCSVPRTCESWTTWNRSKLSNAAWAMTALGSFLANKMAGKGRWGR